MIFTKIHLILTAVTTGIAAFFIGYGIGYWVGDGNGYDRALQKMAEKGAQAATQAGQHKERVEHVEKNLDDAGIDAALYELGIMRRNDDR